MICNLYTIKTYIYFRRNTYNCRAVWTFFKGAIHLHFKFSIMFINIINYVKMWKRSLTYEIIQFKVLTNRLLMACLRRQFEANHRPEAPESWHQLNQTIWPEVCITHLKACKQVLAKNNSRTKRSNLTKFTSWLTFSHISLSQKNHYKMKMIPIVSKKVELSKNVRGEPGTLTGVYVNSVYSWPRWRQSIWLFSFPPSNLASGAAVMGAL